MFRPAFDVLCAKRNPVHVRRQAFFRASQKEGQSVLDFRAQLRQLGNEGDLENLTLEGCYCLMYQLGVKDEVLRRELCKVQQPNLAEFDAILEAHALMEASEKLRNKTAQANRASGPAKKSSSSSSGSPKIKITAEEKKRRQAVWEKCYRCASSNHMIPGCKVPATVTCKLCNFQGHISPACLKSTSSARASAADSPHDSGQLQLQYSPSSPPASSFYVPQPYQQYNQPTPQLPL